MTQPPKPQRQIRLEIPNNLNATYSNAVLISQTFNEIICDFIQMIPNDPRARVQSRVIMTPTNAKSFLNALQQNLTRYEQVHGEIKPPPKPETLADQLFKSVKPDDNNDQIEQGDDE